MDRFAARTRTLCSEYKIDMDAFSEVLKGIALKGTLFFRAEFSAPWGYSSPLSLQLAPLLSPGAPHLVIFHFVIEGSATVYLQEGSTLPLTAGDVIVMPHGHPHRMCSVNGIRETETSTMLAKVRARDFSIMHAGGGGDVTRFVCGYMTCDPLLSRPILEGLPPAFKINLHADRSGRWLENSILYLVEEAASGNAGSEAMLAKLSEALFLDTLRRYIAGLPDQEVGWLAGARDPLVGKALTLLHARSRHAWTLAELAKEVGVSRTSLVERFTRYLSEPPIAYLMRWRLRLAARALTATSRGVAEIAADVGYESEAAFNRAFKREFGVPPARYRREQRKQR